MLKEDQDSKLKAVENDEEEFARNGLRTLYFGYKLLQPAEIIQVEGEDWSALTVKDVESDIILLGASGIEDLLQDDVSTCI